MRINLLLLCVLAVLSGAVVAQDAPPESTGDDSGYYVFLGAEVLTRYKSKTLPITSADNEGIYVKDGKRNRRVAWSSPCMATPKLRLSNRLLSIENLSHSFFYGKNSELEERAYRDMRKHEQDIALRIAMNRPTGGSSANQSNTLADLEAERENFERQMESMIQENRLVLDGHADSISLQFTLTVPEPLPEAYCAVMVGYRIIEGDAQLGARRVAVKVHRLGDLTPASPTDVSFSLFLDEGDYRDAQIELFFFSGDASPLPTNLSRQLKKLSAEEYEKLRD